MRGDEGVVVQMRIGVMDARDFLRLTGRQCLIRIKTPCSRQKSLTSKDFMKAWNTACKTMLRIENRRVTIRDLHSKRQHFRRHSRL